MFDIDWQRVADVLCYSAENPMIFSSGVFLFLFLGFALIYSTLSRFDTLRIIFVTAFSYYFYYKSSGAYFWLLALITTSDYFIAQAIAKVDQHKGKMLIALSLVLDLGMLAYFKYTNFIGESLCSMLNAIGMALPEGIAASITTQVEWHRIDIFLPVGISFFVFQSLSYTIDVYRRQIEPLHRLLDYAFYVSFFPQLVAGPIVRARDFIPQIRRPLVVTNKMFGTAVFLIIAGLLKKAVISDYISVNFVERVFDAPTLYSGLENLLAVYGYTLQIYCDFSGYSDMAIGIALMLGFEFPANFNSPYKSSSITEFWRRWHISLSSWLKDYLYISLGGNRKGKLRQYLNLLITMLLGGLWHGASLNFILWGGIHGVLLCLDKIWKALCPWLSPLSYMGERRSLWSLPLRLMSGVLTFHLVAACWVLFRASSFEVASQVFSQIINRFEPQILMQWLTSYGAVAALMILGYAAQFMPASLSNRGKTFVERIPLVAKAALIVIVAFIIIQIKSADVQPFIYFQF